MPNLRQEIEESRKRPATSDWLVTEQRRIGLRFVVRAREGQTEDEVRQVFRDALHEEFQVEPLFPAPMFQRLNLEEAASLPLDHHGFVASLPGVGFGDLPSQPFDLAHHVRAEGAFVEVLPDGVTARPRSVLEVSEEPTAAGIRNAWALAQMKVPEAWEKMGGNRGRGVRIGHPDTGYANHELWGGREIQWGIRPDLGWNFLPRPGEPEKDPRDPLERRGHIPTPGHGTHAASVMVSPGSVVRDGEGRWRFAEGPGQITGAAPDAINIPLRCIDSVFILPGHTELARAIRFAIDIRQCQVVSLSLGGFLMRSWLEEVIQYAVRKNCIVAASSGSYPPNDETSWPTASPASFPDCIGVAGTDGGSQPWRGSGWWPRGTVDISAPAGPGLPAAVASLVRLDGYQLSAGTTYSAALLASVAALWFSHHYPNGYSGPAGSAQYRFLRHAKETAHKPLRWDEKYGAGIPDALRLIQSRPPAEIDVPVLQPCSATEELAMLAGIGSVEAAGSLLSEILKGDDVEAWSGEVGYILQADTRLRLEVNRLAETRRSGSPGDRTKTNDAIRSLLSPHASQALRARLEA